jgi:hypothetical protein
MRAFLLPRTLLAAAPLALLLVASAAAAQPPQEVLFPGQTGPELRASIRAAYRPTAVTGDNDDLYSVIDRTTVGGQDGVVCVYTGWFVPFDCNPSCDPSQDVFNDGAGINQEHTWPQSLLAGVAVDDLHPIFPSQVGVNADRGNLRFAEIPDEQTSRWYRGAPPYNQTTPPPLDERDEYSELRTGVSFEPREVHEGNVARALFYVYTVHDTQTSGAFPFDAAQQRTLYEWHYLDPTDQAEYDRTFRVAPFQQGKPNPFVLDSTLLRRAYPELTTANEPPPPQAALTAAPNPFRDGAVLRLTLRAPAEARVEVFDALGRRVALLHDGPLPGGAEVAFRLDGRALPPGLYVARVTAGAFMAVRRLVRGP